MEQKKGKKTNKKQNVAAESGKGTSQKNKKKTTRTKKEAVFAQTPSLDENLRGKQDLETAYLQEESVDLSHKNLEETSLAGAEDSLEEREPTSSSQEASLQNLLGIGSIRSDTMKWLPWAEGVGAGSLFLYAFKTRSWKRAVSFLLGGALLYRAWRSYQRYQQDLLTQEAWGQKEDQGLLLEQTMVVKESAEKVYQFFRSFKNLKKWLGHEGHLHEITNQHLRWTVAGKDHTFVSFDAEIIADVPRKLIAWRSLEGSSLSHEGSLHFRSLGKTRGTEVHVMLKFDPPAGNVVTTLFEQHPMEVLSQGLAQVKQELERAEVPELASV